MIDQYDLIVIGAGSGGITAAEFGAKLGISVALIEQDRIGGDCTWTGCVPSKALLKVAKVAHQVRSAGEYGLEAGSLHVSMSDVKAYIQQAIDQVYQHETPDIFEKQGIDVITGRAIFINDRMVQVGGRQLTGKRFVIATGASPLIPALPGLNEVAFTTYLQLFENDRLPNRLIVIGAGPIGCEVAQAYQRLGSKVVLVGHTLLPKDEPEAVAVMAQVFAQEGIQFIAGHAEAVRQEGGAAVVTVNGEDYRGDLLLVATGRKPNVEHLDLEQAGVCFGSAGIQVDPYLRTNISHILAIGDCVAGNYQFTHLAGWQGVQAVRNAFLPVKSKDGWTKIVPWTTFTDPEVAHVGLTEAQARQQIGKKVAVVMWPLSRLDRAISDNAQAGFIKVVHTKNGRVLGATIVAERAGELISEFALALKYNLKLFDIANVIHPYPTYAVGIMQSVGDAAVNQLLDGPFGPIMRGLARLAR